MKERKFSFQDENKLVVDALRDLAAYKSRYLEAYSPNGEFEPPVDVTEKKSCYIVKIDMPGVRRETIAVTIQDNILNIKGERTSEDTKEEIGKTLLSERLYGSFHYKFKLKRDLSSNNYCTTLKKGVLYIELQK